MESALPVLRSTAMPVTGRSASCCSPVLPRLPRATMGCQVSPRLVDFEKMMLGFPPTPPSWVSQPFRAMYRLPSRPKAGWAWKVPRGFELQFGYEDGEGELCAGSITDHVSPPFVVRMSPHRRVRSSANAPTMTSGLEGSTAKLGEE